MNKIHNQEVYALPNSKIANSQSKFVISPNVLEIKQCSWGKNTSFISGRKGYKLASHRHELTYTYCAA